MRRDIFTTTLFLAICILMTISTVIGLVDGTMDILGILYVIAFWQLYSTARSGKDLAGFGLGIGTVKASWIIGWIVAGVLAVCGVIIMFIPSSAVHTAVDYSFSITGPGSEELLDDVLEFFGQYGMIWIGVILLLIAVVVAVINILYTKRFYTFARSLRDCMDKPEWFPEEAEPLRKWMFVLGILGCLGILGGLYDDSSSIQSVSRGVSLILGSIWIKNLPDYRIEQITVDTSSTEDSWYS